MLSLFVATFLKFFFLLTPFFALSMFLAMTPDLEAREWRLLADRVILAALIITLTFFVFGQFIFWLFGIGVDAFFKS